MILVDTGVWADYFRKINTKYSEKLKLLIEADEDIVLADIIVMEILQGIKDNKIFREIKQLLLDFPIYSTGGLEICLKSAELYRNCRKHGLTIRKSIDCLIAVVAIDNNLELFHNDRDFDMIAKQSNLKIYKF